MIQVNIESAIRSVFGKGEMRRLRSQEMTPANLYSGGQQPVALQFNEADLFKKLMFIHGRNAVVTLKIEGDSKAERHVLLQEIQKDPVTDELIHVDFLEIDLNRELNFTVPLKFSGKAKGVELGGDLQTYRDSVRLRGCPLDIPDEIVADITNLERGGTAITYGDLQINPKVTMMEKASTACAEVI